MKGFRHMTSNLFRGLAVVSIVGLTVLPAAGQTQQTTRTVAIGESGEFNLSNISGDIVVRSGGGREATIQITKRLGRGDVADLDLVEVEIEERGDRVDVRTNYPRNRRNIRVSVDFTVTVPRGTEVAVTSVSGDVEVSDVEGETRLVTVSGTVTASAVPHLALAKSVSGDVELNSIDTDDDLEAASVSGRVRARDVRARRLDVGTVSGDVDLTNVTSDRADVSSVSGRVEFSGSLVSGGRYELESHSGDVQVSLTEDVGFELEARSFTGEIRSELELAGAESAALLHAPHRRLSGVHGDGGAVLEITTFSGDILVRER